MSKTTISVGQAPLIIIKSVGEDVRIRGHELDEIFISADDESVDYKFRVSEHYETPTSDKGETVNAENDGERDDSDTATENPSEAQDSRNQNASSENVVEIGPITGDGMLDVPTGASLRIGTIGGDIQIRSVYGSIEIETIGEDLSATKTGPLTVDSVGADASIKRVSGDVTIKNVGNDASCNDIEGDITISVGEDLTLADIRGNLNAKVGEDTILRFPLIDGSQYSVIAGGDIACYLPGDTNAEVMLRSGTRTLRVRGWEVPAPPEDELYTFTLGDGGASLNLNAGEDIALVNQENSGEAEFDFDFDFDFGPGFQFRFDSDGFRPEQFSNLFSEKIQAKVQNAMRQAEESIANAISHAESRIADAERRASNFEAKWTGRRPRGPKSRHAHPAEDRRRRRDTARQERRRRDARPEETPQPEKAKITEAERLMVLRMVEEGKISVEQAEKLLSAMGS